MAKPKGRPAKPLPGWKTLREHEERRARLRLSKRAYAAFIGVSQATYCRRTMSRSKAERRKAARRGPRTPQHGARRLTLGDAIVHVRETIAKLQSALRVLEGMAGRA